MKKLILACTLAAALLAPSAWAVDALTAEAAEAMAYMREEEKLAHDVYAYFDALYGEPAPGSKVFGRIADSETRHTEAVKALLDYYDQPDPDTGVPGIFTNLELQALYDTLIDVGSQSLEQAFAVGVIIEERDMTDIVEAIEVSLGYTNVVDVYSKLLAASENHLEAFLKVAVPQ